MRRIQEESGEGEGGKPQCPDNTLWCFHVLSERTLQQAARLREELFVAAVPAKASRCCPTWPQTCCGRMF